MQQQQQILPAYGKFTRSQTKRLVTVVALECLVESLTRVWKLRKP